MIAHESALMRDQIARLEQANIAATTRRKRQKKRIQKQGTLTRAEAEEIIAQKDVKQQLDSETSQDRAQSGAGRQAVSRCSRCRETGHNARTCAKRSVDTT